jgi:Bacterial membrane protein YfhO.
MKKIDKNYIILTILPLFFVFVIIPKGSMFGSYVDWLPQHITFPEYFRNLFYETKDLFPDFALALGSGQNIYNFSYYGFLNPLLLPSYLLPFVNMKDYIIGLNIILYISTALLSYKWLKKHFSDNISLVLSVLLICASPILFHFHRHFMFVSYFPFLIIGLIGVEEYFEKNKKFKLVLSTFLIIMVSYFYSVPSILVFILCGVYNYLKTNKKITIKTFIKDGFFFVIPILIGISLSGILLFPTAATLFGSRGSSGNSLTMIDMIKPNFDMSLLFYDAYGVGLGALAFISLIYNLYQKNKEKLFLTISILVCLLFPFISYILNGFLYIRGKVFIPFIPLFILLIGFLLNDIINKKINYKLPLTIVIMFSFLRFNMSVIYFDIMITLLILFLIKKYGKKEKRLLVLLIIPIVSLYVVNIFDDYVEKDYYKKIIEPEKEIKKILEKEKGMVRFSHLNDNLHSVNKIYTNNYYKDSIYSSLYNPLYKDFYVKVFNNAFSHRNKLVISQNNNLLYRMFMGNKYIYSDTDESGYEKISDKIYQNDDVLPIFYTNDKIVNEKEFDNLKYPDSVLTLLNNTIIKNKETTGEISNLENIGFSNVEIEKKNIKIGNKDNVYNIKADKKNKLTMKLAEKLNNKVLLIDFELGKEWNCKKGDASIKINGVVNTHTCQQWLYKNNNRIFHYVIADKNLKELKLEFTKGNYNIKNINVYSLDYSELRNVNKSKGLVELEKLEKDKIYLKTDVTKDSYLVTSIPYDKGFIIKDNGKKVKYEVVNKAFVGLKLNKGKHNIVIEYKAPLKDVGILFSIMGLISIVKLYFLDKKRK